MHIHEKSQRLAYAALIAVCVLWGATYLAIRVAVEDIPPLYLISGRYIISGAILLIAAALGGARLPRGRELWYTAVCGVICIGIGNSFLAIVEQWIPSGLSALFYTTCPFWMVGIDAMLPDGSERTGPLGPVVRGRKSERTGPLGPVVRGRKSERTGPLGPVVRGRKSERTGPLGPVVRGRNMPRGVSLAGLVLGFCGVVYLVWPAARGEGITGRTVAGFLLLQVSGIGWSLGSLLQKRVQTRAAPFVSGAVQQFAAGIAVGVPAVIFEKAPHTISLQSDIAVGYLVVFGAIVGFSSYIYSLAHLPVALVSIYLFVNPIVAVFLGWLLLREPFGYRELVSMAIIFAGIALVRWSEMTRGVSTRAGGLDEPAVLPANE